MLHEFWAVTQTSVYRAVAGGRSECVYPVIEKIALRDGKSAFKVGHRLTGGGELIGIMSEGLAPFRGSSRGDNLPDSTNLRNFGEHTSPIVGLFLGKKEAMACFNCEDLDRTRWMDYTRDTVEAIGKNHPVFRLSDELLMLLRQRVAVQR